MSSKTNDSIRNKSTFSEATFNTRHKQSKFSCVERTSETACTSTVDSAGDQAKNQQNRSTLIPATLFGERLLKRMLDEQNMGSKDKQSSRHSIDGNVNRNTDNYMAESDKENGSKIDGNMCKTRENESFTVAQYNGSEQQKHPLTITRHVPTDLQSNVDKNETQSRPQGNAMMVTNNAGKRAHDDTNGRIPAKRFKANGEECSSESTENEMCGNTSSNFSGKRSHTVQNSSIRCSRGSNLESKERSYLSGDASKREERTSSKDRSDAARDKKDIGERSLNRHDKPLQNSTYALGERSVDNRCNEAAKKDDYRASHDGEHRRTRQRERERTDDHRTRVTSTSYAKYTREEKYNRSQGYKHANHDERVEKRYNFRGSNVDKAKQSNCKKDSYNTRCTTKRSILDRISVGGEKDKIPDARTSSPCAEYQCEKLKRPTYRPSKRGRRKYDESDEDFHRKHNTDTSDQHPTKCPANSKQNADSMSHGLTLGEINRSASRANDWATVKEFSTELEDGEILNTPTNSPEKRSRGECPNHDSKEPNLSSDVNGTSITSLKPNNVDPVEELRLSSRPTPDIAVARDKTSSENIESVENVENIEKFIRDSASTRDKAFEGASRKSDAINALDESISNELARIGENVPRSDILQQENRPVLCDSDGKRTRSETRTDRTMVSLSSDSSKDASDQPKILTRGCTEEKRHIFSNTRSSDFDARNQNYQPPNVVIPEYQNINGKEIDKRTTGRNDVRLGELEKTTQSQSNNKSSRNASTNVHGKVVVFARRKKPVCLANSNADMTVLINNECNAGV